jgi:hypothetical protein
VTLATCGGVGGCHAHRSLGATHEHVASQHQVIGQMFCAEPSEKDFSTAHHLTSSRRTDCVGQRRLDFLRSDGLKRGWLEHIGTIEDSEEQDKNIEPGVFFDMGEILGEGKGPLAVLVS